MRRFLVFTLICFLFLAKSYAGDNPKSIRAVRITTPPRIDGRLDDAIWKLAEPATDFIQRDPEEGKPGSERSEIRVLYDDEALYFSCIYFDAAPEKIVSRLTRRDDVTESDGASIFIDSYHDHQTGYEFTFNVAGVKIDRLQYDDANKQDDSWDPVWEVQTSITPQGWAAEVKIPFYILRYRALDVDTAENVWGINFLRHISRKQEDERWAFTPKSQSGFISRYGHLLGLRNLPAPKQLEAIPFITGKQSYDPATYYRDRAQKFNGNAGMDIKYGLSSNFLIDATINPDFGQVEADPAVLNLSTFETFYPEKRPFFVEGTQIIRFSTFGGDFGPGMFYSRRIGRAILEREVDVPPGGKILDLPKNTTILGAVKLTGKTNNGFSIGMLEAFTQEEKAVVADSLRNQSEQVVEPFGHYHILRLRKDLWNNSNVGMIFTSVEKQQRNPAFTNGYDWNLKFQDNTYQVDGFLAISHATNSNNERITGSAGKTQLSKISGEHWLWSLSTDYTSKKYNINDVGFFFSPNDFGGVFALNYKEDVPAAVVRNYTVGIFLHLRSNFDGVNISRNVRLNGGLLFSNYWNMTAGAEADFGLYDPYETRGIGIYLKPASFTTSTSLSSDQRENIIFTIGEQFDWDNKTKRQFTLNAGIKLKPLSWMNWDLQSDYQIFRNQEAWVGSNENAGIVYFGNRNTDRLSVTLRSTVTFTRELTLQFYGQEFLAKGQYRNYRQLVGTSDFIPVSVIDPLWRSDFNNQSFNTNLVLRWEYLPGSTIFLVWSQARTGGDGDYTTSLRDNFDETFRIPPSNVFLLKINYWWHL
jgi:hypothetical protein